MNYYSITYDLVNQRNYPKITKAINDISKGFWAKPTESQWIIRTHHTSRAVRDFLLNHVDSDDVLFVISVDIKDGAWFNISSDVANWIRT